MLPVLLLALQGASQGVPVPQVPTTDVRPPRIEAEIVVDGVLDEEVWRQAAVLRGFTQFAPVDGVPAADSTRVLVWYSPAAIHFGIRAFESHGAVRATLADRDRIFNDDNIQILLGTFNDGRQATVFAVNPLGVQADGAIVETGRVSGGSFTGGNQSAREPTDLSQDYVFQSRGRLVPDGYEVEIRIPFKSLRYQSADNATWSLNIVRQVQHSGYEDTWAPARRSGASFLAQSGHLVGLTDLRRGLVLDVTPEVTARATGGPGADGWRYDTDRPEVGGTVRWGIRNNLTLNGTANPDFSQVESDAGQFNFDPRQALFFSEKRPFFLDGLEQFNTPNSLVYTRQVVQPVAAVKLTGKALGGDIGFLSAVDDPGVSGTPDDHPVFNILRIQRDLGSGSRLGLVYTDRLEGDDYNRVAGIDGRLVLGSIYALQFQGAASRTRESGVTTTAPLWMARFTRTGRAFRMRYTINAIDEDFRSRSGFISRPGIVNANLDQNYTVFGRPGVLLESFTTDFQLDGTWKYQNFVDGNGIQDRKLHVNLSSSLRGGWRAGASVLVEDFGYDPDLYTRYALEVPAGAGGVDTIPFVGRERIPNLDWVLNFSTPQVAGFQASGFYLWGHDENFFEWASANLIFAQGNLLFRPTERIRLTGSYIFQRVGRRSDGSAVEVRHLPRLKLEYQVSRAFFVRLVGEYNFRQLDSLRNESGNGEPILVLNPGTGAYGRTSVSTSKTFRADVLLSYQPLPGTVAYLGYGNTLQEPNPYNQDGLHRVADGFFAKLSYLFRL